MGDRARDLVARTGLPVLLLADLSGEPTLTAGTGDDPPRYISTTALYQGGLRAEIHAPGGPKPEQLVRAALPGGSKTSTGYLATPGEMTLAVEVGHDGLLARAAVWRGWTLLQLTEAGRSRLPGLRLIGADSLPTGRPGRIVTLTSDS
ncbi:hypothetical protein [Kitasatospora brasiliensis]|uniref:hypothetical protein n=1 Tax=Kitasatospora brasiliensis TaxID=3058040 RepID=UPI00292E02C0|nr:hypothetical protein [Kitasatospora sp. K002]